MNSDSMNLQKILQQIKTRKFKALISRDLSKELEGLEEYIEVLQIEVTILKVSFIDSIAKALEAIRWAKTVEKHHYPEMACYSED